MKTQKVLNALTGEHEFVVSYSEEDKCYIGRCLSYKLLAAHGKTPIDALHEIQELVKLVEEDLVPGDLWKGSY